MYIYFIQIRPVVLTIFQIQRIYTVKHSTLMPCKKLLHVSVRQNHHQAHLLQEFKNVGQGPLVIEASRSHSDTPHSVGHLYASDQPDAAAST
jgi:hypothetical protein